MVECRYSAESRSTVDELTGDDQDVIDQASHIATCSVGADVYARIAKRNGRVSGRGCYDFSVFIQGIGAVFKFDSNMIPFVRCKDVRRLNTTIASRVTSLQATTWGIERYIGACRRVRRGNNVIRAT
ncbi:hypothetical protein D3C73_1326070 [compost metagenome]